eukprot:3265316-Pleurochrysis_carterae.AAC.1
MAPSSDMPSECSDTASCATCKTAAERRHEGCGMTKGGGKLGRPVPARTPTRTVEDQGICKRRPESDVKLESNTHHQNEPSECIINNGYKQATSSQSDLAEQR